jgi:hypothetical protein
VASERATPNVQRFESCRFLGLRLGNNVWCERWEGDVLWGMVYFRSVFVLRLEVS